MAEWIALEWPTPAEARAAGAAPHLARDFEMRIPPETEAAIWTLERRLNGDLTSEWNDG